MVSLFLTWKRAALVAWLLAFGLGLATAQAQTVGGGSLGSTNSRPAAGPEKPLPGQGTMDRFETELFGSQKRLNLQPSDANAPQRPLQPVVIIQPDELAKQKMDAEKNWVFSGMNQLNTPPKPEDLLGMPEIGPDGVEKPKLSAMDQFYSDLGGQQSGTNTMTEMMSMVWTMQQLTGTNGVNPLVFAMPIGDPAMMKTLMMLPEMNHANGEAATPNDSATPSDSMAAAEAAASADRDEKRRSDTFKQLLGLSPSGPVGAPSAFGGGNSYQPAPAVTAPAYAPVYSPLAPPENSLSPVAGGFTPSAGSGYHPADANFSNPGIGVGGPNFDNSRTAVAQPASLLPPPVLDPFAANFPKRKF